jgi:hypothetical protein
MLDGISGDGIQVDIWLIPVQNYMSLIVFEGGLQELHRRFQKSVHFACGRNTAQADADFHPAAEIGGYSVT